MLRFCEQYVFTLSKGLNLQPFFTNLFGFTWVNFFKIGFKNNILQTILKVTFVFGESKCVQGFVFLLQCKRSWGGFAAPWPKQSNP